MASLRLARDPAGRTLGATGVTLKVELEQTIGRRITLSATFPEALLRGYGEALAEALSALRPLLRGAVNLGGCPT